MIRSRTSTKNPRPKVFRPLSRIVNESLFPTDASTLLNPGAIVNLSLKCNQSEFGAEGEEEKYIFCGAGKQQTAHEMGHCHPQAQYQPQEP